jgi:hypothetical protein
MSDHGCGSSGTSKTPRIEPTDALWDVNAFGQSVDEGAPALGVVLNRLDERLDDLRHWAAATIQRDLEHANRLAERRFSQNRSRLLVLTILVFLPIIYALVCTYPSVY